LDFFVEIFDKADADGSGDVDADELLEELKEAGMNVTKEGVEAMIAHVDEDGDGKLSREEWTESVNHYLKKKKNCHKIDLRSLVRDSSGNLDIKDGSDSDGSGKISFPIKNEILVPLKGDSLMVGQDIENTTAHYDYYEEVKKS